MFIIGSGFGTVFADQIRLQKVDELPEIFKNMIGMYPSGLGELKSNR